MFQGLRLLLWKNWKIQSRSKLSLLLEVIAPTLFVIVFISYRFCLKWKDFEEPTQYPAFSIRGNPSAIVRNNCSIIYYAPMDQQINKTISIVEHNFFKKDGLNYTFKGFKGETEMENAYRKSLVGLSGTGNETTSPVLAGIFFYNNSYEHSVQDIHRSRPKNIKYKIKMPAVTRTWSDPASRLYMVPTWSEDNTYMMYRTSGPRNGEKIEGGAPGYFDEGFLYLQYALDFSITRQLVEYNESLVEQHEQLTQNIQLQRFPFEPYTREKLYPFFDSMQPITFASCLTYSIMCFTRQIIEEKSKRLKEFTKIMGLVTWIHWASWFIQFFLIQSVSAAAIAIALKIEIKGKAVMMRTDPLIVFSTYLINSLPVIGYSFIFSTFFSTPETGATAAGLVWIVIFLTWYVVINSLYKMSRLTTYLAGIVLPLTGFNTANILMANMETMGVGSRWDNIFTGLYSVGNTFSVADAWLLMTSTGLIYILLAFYIDLVFPGTFGVPLPWYFPCTKWYWSGGIQGGDILEENQGPSKEVFEGAIVDVDNDRFNEVASGDLHVGVEISNLTKRFKGKAVVNSLSVKMYEGQVTSVLGHNGAGKTTTMSILTGLIRPSSGTAYVNSFDIRKDMNHIRRSLGLCPQYNILYENLTVEEHLQFFCELKGHEPGKIPREIGRMLVALDLVDKRSAPTKTLSGGMKRKLCVGIAFTADPKTVVLDEPTAGMDIEARKSTWDLIQSQKPGRTVLLSTHYMEEADLLGDRIMILSGGQLQCCGSSLFLKEKYGGDYSLVMVKKEPCNIPALCQVIEDIVPSAIFNRNVDSELKYTLPVSYINKYATLFDLLDDRKDELGIDSYGVSSTTMEEIFLRVGMAAKERHVKDNLNFGHDHEHLSTSDGGRIPSTALSVRGANLESFKNPANLGDERNTGLCLLWHQFCVLFLKKLLVTIRDWELTLLLIAVPVIVIETTLFTIRFFPGVHDEEPLLIHQDKFRLLKHSPFLLNCQEEIAEFCGTLRQFVTQFTKMVIVDTNSSIAFHSLEAVRKNGWKFTHKTMLALEVGSHQQLNETVAKSGSQQITAFFNNEPLHTAAFALNFVSNAILHSLGTSNVQLSAVNGPFKMTTFDQVLLPQETTNAGYILGCSINFGIAYIPAAFVIFATRERVCRFVHLQVMAGASKIIMWLANFLIDLFVCFLGVIGVLCIAHLNDYEEYNSWKTSTGLVTLLMMYGIAGISMSMFLSTVCTQHDVVYGRIVFVQGISGICASCIIDYLESPDIFDFPELAKPLHLIFSLLPGYCVSQGVRDLSRSYKLERVCKPLDLTRLCRNEPHNSCCTEYQENIYAWHIVAIGKKIVGMAIVTLCFVLLLVAKETNLQYKMQLWLERKKSPCLGNINTALIDRHIPLENIDADVAEENRRINQSELHVLKETDCLVLKNLCKVYKKKLLAVDHLNLGVKKREIFGLLGINGAGKTTVFKILTGDLTLSTGDAFIDGYSVKTDLQKAHSHIGYCPQFDACLDQLTGMETLVMFAVLKGIKRCSIPGLIDHISESLLFKEFLQNRVGSYSGGNKRKLSTALSMIGQPSVIFLDEPTAGMDPEARRHVWNAISLVRDSGTSVLLTSHLMEEAEALCSRLGVMVKGRFRCLGSPQHLKHKLGGGLYIVAQMSQTPSKCSPNLYNQAVASGDEDDSSGIHSVSDFDDQRIHEDETFSKLPGKTKSPPSWLVTLKNFDAFITKKLPGCKLEESHTGYVKYHLAEEKTPWSKIFAGMEEAKNLFNLEAYSVGQVNMENVFFKCIHQD